MKPILFLIFTALTLGPVAVNAADSLEPESQEGVAEKPETSDVTEGELKVSVEFEGTVLPVEGEAVFFDPKAWTSFSVIKALPHGTRVKKGEAVVEVDLENLEKAIVDQKASVEKLRTQVQESELGLQRLKRNQEWAFEKAELALTRKKQDHERFLEVSVPIKKRDAKHMLEVAERQLANEVEELEQLTAMYEEDELTEETEEIILIRQKNQVDDARYKLEKQELATEYALETIIPREIEDDQKALQVSQLTFDDIQLDQEFESTREAQKHATLGLELERAEQRLEDLLADFGNASFQAPIDGTVFYGMIEASGVWDPADAHKSLLRGGSLVPRKPLFSIIPDGATLQLVARVDAATASKLEVGLHGHAGLEGSQALRTPVRRFLVSESTAIDGKSVVVAELEPANFLAPALSLKVKASGFMKGSFTLVPTKAVKTTSDGGLEVEVQHEDGSFEKRSIRIQAEGESELSVAEGLQVGDVVKAAQ